MYVYKRTSTALHATDTRLHLTASVLLQPKHLKEKVTSWPWLMAAIFVRGSKNLTIPKSKQSYPRISSEIHVTKTDRIYHRSLKQTEKSQSEGKRIMPETRFTSFPALSVDLRVGISRSASDADD